MKAKLDAEVAGARGTLKLTTKNQGRRQDLVVEARVGLGDPIAPDEAEYAVVTIAFPDGTRCEPERKVRGGDVRYRLELRERNGQLEERRGTCAPAGIPDLTGTVTVEYDADDDPTTENAPLLKKTF